MYRNLKTLDKVVLVSFIVILSFGLVSSVAVNKMLTNIVYERAKLQTISAAELMAGTVASEIASGNFRSAWQMVNLNVGKNHFTAFLLLDNFGNPIVSDTEAEAKILPDLQSEERNFEFVNDQTRVKKLSSLGRTLVEYKFTNISNGKGATSFVFLFEDSEVTKVQLQVSSYLFGYVLLIIVLLSILIYFFRSRLLIAVSKVNQGLEAILMNKKLVDEHTIFSEYIQSKQTLEKFAIEFEDAKTRLEDQVKIKTLGDITRQVAHDIRSPLSALNMVMHGLGGISEERRVLIRGAVQRINDIANDLLKKGGLAADTNTIHFEDSSVEPNHNSALDAPILLPSIVESLLSEKRIQFRDKINVKIESDLTQSFGIFVSVNGVELARILSNLINNSIESFSNFVGEVNVTLKSTSSKAIILIKDNGSGIPSHIIEKLGKVEISFGKSGTNSGNGLGVFHAVKTIEDWRGKVQFFSEVNVGTLIEITLPLADAPRWFAAQIPVHEKMELIALDDDVSIHQIWQGRVRSAFGPASGIRLRCFTSVDEFKRLAVTNDMFFLIDYELLGQSNTGLDIIRQKQISKNSILVTSRSDEVHIRRECERMGVKILPKQLAGFVPFLTEN